MAKLCGRPGCSEPGTVAYGMVPEDLLFWVAPLDGDVGADAAVLCRRHADAMVVPRGWTLDDRREPTLRLFRPKGAGDDTGSLRRPRRRRDATPPGGIPQQLFDLPDEHVDERPVADPPEDAVPVHDDTAADDSAADDAAAADAAAAEPWRPAFDPDDDLGGLLEADSPLLARAFRGTGRRRA